MSNKGLNIIFDTDSTPEFLVESVLNEAGAEKKQYKIKGIFSTIGEVNKNGREYPRLIWETEVNRYQQNFSTGSIDTLMEYPHPPRTEVDPMEAVAKITELKIDGNYVMGEAVLLDNVKANQLKSLIDHGIKVSVSSRGVGSVKNGVVENFKLITYDIVPVPSDYNATMNGVVEGYTMNEGIIEGLQFNVNESGDITTFIGDNYEQEDIAKAIKQKFTDILESLKPV